MEDLYYELWGQPLPVNKNYEVQVPVANYGLRPGYKIGMKLSRVGTFVPPEFRSKREKKVFTMMEVTAYLPCGVQKLLVRPQYDALRHKLIRAENTRWLGAGKSLIPAVRGKLDYEISGQPGTGKTFFLSYLLVCRLCARLPTVYRKDDQRFYLFDRASPGLEITLKQLSDLPPTQKRRLWVLTDEKIDDTHWYPKTLPWFVVLAASPNKTTASEQWHKERNPAKFYMSIWGWPEIFAAYCLEVSVYPTQDEINKLFTTFECLGPVPRTCFQTIIVSNDDEYNESLETYLSEIDRAIQKFILEGGRETIEQELHANSSHKITIMQPSKSGFSFTPRLITRWIAFRVYETALRHSQLESFRLYKNLSQQTNLRSAAGWFLESYVHEWFLFGGKFEADEMPVVNTMATPLVLNAVRAEKGLPEYFQTPEDLRCKVKGLNGRGINHAVLKKYFLPWSRNYPSIDGLLFQDPKTIVFFQITLAAQHEIKSPGVAVLLNTLPKTIKNVYFVFVVPEHCADHYSKAQLIPDSAAISPSMRTKLNVKQFRLVFREKEMQAVAVRGYRGGYDSEVEVFDDEDSD
ncbi:hypothetical protein B9Z19DRAFT_1120916 [Tuber borchii]|uniref:Crinkler (CRN) family protein n=1 Tax=Tuber borchii TaxID=42251 RepID=A0A2T7A3J3_TUBBO|nr:hypothetical protein B9Z19DRAFT_1120916 [Tuber borchii]